jgi:hypothetical protein
MIPNELMRPSWCPDKTCGCIDSWGNSGPDGYIGVLCVGRLQSLVPHSELFNTHNFCLNSDGAEEDFVPASINYADATYITKLMKLVQIDIEENGLYIPEQNG